MIDINSILCPIDFSDFSRHALAHAIALTRRYEALLTVFHAYPIPVEPPPMLYGGFPGMARIGTLPRMTVSPVQVHDDTVADVKRFCSSMDTARLNIRFEARSGGAVDNILEEAAKVRADLIVLGTHGRGGLGRWVIGSVADHVLREASCAVLTVPPSITLPPADPLIILKRILCPIDFSETSLRALAYGLSLAEEADAELTILHVVADTPGYLRLSEQGAVARLNAMVPPDARTWCRPNVLLAAGNPLEEILRTAADRDIHLIVMGVHTRNPLDVRFLRSITYHLVRAAPCPVLTLRSA